ncbi:MAG: roadblock/LC7 domain-containing protein [Candidatus Hodarchaeota archaeon]
MSNKLDIKNRDMNPELESIDDALKKLVRAIPDVKAVSLLSNDGMPLAFILPEEIDDLKISGIAAALLSMSELASVDMQKGSFNQLYIKGTDGYLLLLEVGPNHALLISASNDVRLGMLLFETNLLIERIISIIPLLEFE